MVRKKSEKKLLTEAELELMSILWRRGESTVNDVLGECERDLAYTSVSTILRILEQKGVVTSRKEGKGHLYRASLSKKEYESTSLNHLVKKVFEGTPSSLVRCLIESKNLSEEDLKSIQALLEERLG